MQSIFLSLQFEEMPFKYKIIYLEFNRIHSISTFFGVENELSNIIELALDHNQIVDI